MFQDFTSNAVTLFISITWFANTRRMSMCQKNGMSIAQESRSSGCIRDEFNILC
ncbi:hypothetical protein Clim_0518 [Chlorobium limicola DSM 245]|uniref:Uncharacterized protein n=1 Tax=Chlorobium limicola (strain DSM 245 / NBRC 103803 / 6330) TaxID=290315 RepID=B3EGH3_CHLL2|nr:hypothetical protein Clim_0518 [Chlorobium limicola DSM 245]